MKKQKRIFDATFQDSCRLVTKKSVEIVGDERGLKTMKFTNKITGSILALTFSPLGAWALNIGMAEGMLYTDGESINVISIESAHAIGLIGTFIEPLSFLLLFLWFFVILVNLFPKNDYSSHYAWGTITLMVMMLLFSPAVFLLSAGFTIDSFGWLGLILLSFFGLFWVIVVLKRSIDKVLNIIFLRKEEINHSNNTNKVLKLFLLICLVVSVLNRFSLRLGFASANSSLFSWFYGWAILIFWGLLAVCISIMIPRVVRSIYLMKYSEQYRVYFEVSKEKWYSKRKARRLQKKRKNES